LCRRTGLLEILNSRYCYFCGGNGGGHGGGHGGGNGGNGKSSEAHGNAKGHAKTSDADVEATDEETESEGLAPNELGKLNGVLHASPNAIAHASANSPIGTAREFGEALAGFLDSAETPEEDAARPIGATAAIMTEVRRLRMVGLIVAAPGSCSGSVRLSAAA
jgi:hypothetical protein